MKACFKCRALKPLSEFYPHAAMADGHLNKCKECARRDASERRRNMQPADVRREQAARNKSEAGRAGRRRWIATNRRRVLAVARCARAVAYAVQTGRVVRGTECARCGAAGPIEAAHRDYSKPLDVEWLCVPCHRAWDHAEPKTKNVA
jgi:hypothetical protein